MEARPSSLPGDLPEANGTCLNDASMLRIVQWGSPSGEAAELHELGGQGRDRTADLAVFSRVRLVRFRPAWFAAVAFPLVSKDPGDLSVQGDTGLCGPVQGSRAERRQNRTGTAVAHTNIRTPLRSLTAQCL